MTVKVVVFPAASRSFDLTDDEVNEVAKRPVALLFKPLASEIVFEPDLPVITHVEFLAVATIKLNFEAVVAGVEAADDDVAF